MKLLKKEINSLYLLYMSILFGVINFFIRYPGKLNPDSIKQLQEAILGSYTDWHPPIMSIIWRELLPLGDATIVMLILQISIYWLGIYLFAIYLYRNGYKKASIFILFSGFTPIALKYSGVILKDSLMTSLFIVAFGLATFKDNRLRYLGLIVGFIAMLMRANAIFAYSPLVIFVFREKLSIIKYLLYALIISAILIPISMYINHNIFQAKKTGVERSLQIYDLVGTAYFSNDTSILPVNIQNLSKCYTPLYWDTIATKRCDYTFSKLDNSITKEWILGISKHPIAYLKHRLNHFNYEIFFLVPPIQQCVEAPEGHDCPRSLISDFITKNAFLWPITWLILGVVMLFWNLNSISKVLVISALLYGFAYLVVGVASHFRYFYWTEIAIMIALIIHIAMYKFDKWRVVLISLSIVWILGYLWRFKYIIS